MIRPFMIRPLILAASLIAITQAAQAAERLRGTIEQADAGTLKLKTADGKSVDVALTPATTYRAVEKSSLSAIKDGVFIGTATKGDNPPVALEVVLFPESMRGSGEGHYDWDVIPDTTKAGAGSPTKSAMTNGTVQRKPLTKSAMTNGAVKSSAASGGSTKLTVTYKGGGSLDIVVPPTAPIVMFAAADASILKPGAKVFAIVTNEGGKLTGKMVAAGKDGVTPPM